MKATAKLNGYQGIVNIIETTESGYEIELLEGTLKGKRTFVSLNSNTESIQLLEKVTAKIEKSGHNEDSNTVVYYIECNNKETLLKIVDYITDNSIEIEALGTIDNLYDNIYSSGVVVDYQHGEMKRLDKEVKIFFKEIKKILGVR